MSDFLFSFFKKPYGYMYEDIITEHVHAIVKYFSEDYMTDPSMRHAGIDEVIKMLEEFKNKGEKL